MQSVLTVSDPALVTTAFTRDSAAVVRRAEWIIFAFLLYAHALTFFVAAPAGLRARLAILNLAVMLAYAGLIYFDSVRPRLTLDVTRDWLPLAMIVLAYREMGWFALPHQQALLELRWVVWDRFFLGHGTRAAIESLGPVMPSVLEIAYALVYALPPLALAALYFCRRRDMAEQFLTVVLVSVLLCYAQFPFWPSEPPRVVFAGLDLPSYDNIFRRFNLWVLGNYGIHTGVFPSAHVAGAFASAFGIRLTMPDRTRLYRTWFAIAALIAIATVYGRYHYLADAIYGAVIACVVALLVLAGRKLPNLRRRSNMVACRLEATQAMSGQRDQGFVTWKPVTITSVLCAKRRP